MCLQLHVSIITKCALPHTSKDSQLVTSVTVSARSCAGWSNVLKAVQIIVQKTAGVVYVAPQLMSAWHPCKLPWPHPWHLCTCP